MSAVSAGTTVIEVDENNTDWAFLVETGAGVGADAAGGSPEESRTSTPPPPPVGAPLPPPTPADAAVAAAPPPAADGPLIRPAFDSDEVVLDELAGLPAIAALPGYEEATDDLVTSILAESGKFTEEVLAPLYFHHRYAVEALAKSLGGVTYAHSVAGADAQPLVPGEIAELRFDLWATSALIREGHRIRVAIAGADEGTLLRYPRDGSVPVLSVQRSAVSPSRIELPMRPRP